MINILRSRSKWYPSVSVSVLAAGSWLVEFKFKIQSSININEYEQEVEIFVGIFFGGGKWWRWMDG